MFVASTCSDNNSFDAELSRLRENAWEYVHLYLTLTFDFFEGFEPTDTEGREHLDINPQGPRFNLDDLEIPEELVAAFPSASPPQLLPPPPPVNKAPPPPLPPPHVNDSAPPAAPDGISQRLTEAHRLAEQASVMVNTFSLDQAQRKFSCTPRRLSCQTNITAATEALQLATVHLSEARSVNQDESLTELLSDL